MADKFIGDYIGAMSEATATEIKNGVVMVRTASGDLKKAPGKKLGEKAVFEATYGTTTYAAISAAIEAGQAVICVSQGNVYQLDGTVTATGFTFTRSWKNENGKVYTGFVKVDSADAWTSDNVEILKASAIPTPPSSGNYFLVSTNGVLSWVETDVTSVRRVAELPEEPVETTMYAVVEEETSTASETDSEV